MVSTDHHAPSESYIYIDYIASFDTCSCNRRRVRLFCSTKCEYFLRNRSSKISTSSIETFHPHPPPPTHTGSIYSDNALRAGGMNGECVRSGAVIAVKTHKSIPVSWTAEDKPSMAANNTDSKVYG